ncbi:aconitase [Rhodococcoides kroppenstedtii]|uniref:2-methylisocitrate dehydratase n=1 Tax=Rhodococcoides kroppenstedtii TaxID=293050 RepID=A0A1I0SQK5_9NOCA|nr:aconitase [Rhodococcus kroppenstedtii]
MLRLLAENVLRTASPDVRDEAIAALCRWLDGRSSTAEIPFMPGRLMMHDTTSTPALVDIAAMRDVVASRGGDPTSLSPVLPVEISVDHSLAVEAFAQRGASEINLRHDMRRNAERYRFLAWAERAMDTVHVNRPGTGIMHTINLEQLATVVTTETRDGTRWAVPDMMLGTDSHTPMVNGLGVLAWGIGGLEAQSVMFGLPTTLRIPDVVGVRLIGTLGPGVTGTDLALTVTHRLREVGVTGEFVEFFGPGVSTLGVGTRSVVANMAPEYGATTGYFPIDHQVLRYLADTGRTPSHCEFVEAAARQMGLWFDPDATPEYTRQITVDLGAVETSVAGPRRPQDLMPLSAVATTVRSSGSGRGERSYPIAIASITSCTNTSDPRLLVAAGLLARRARERGLTVPPQVKTSLAPGSPAAASLLQRAELVDDLSAVGFDIVGFGCATCIGNSGELTQPMREAAAEGTRTPIAVLSGNRNFPGRVHPDLELGLLMSPPLVIAYALAGDASIDLTTEPLGTDSDGRRVALQELWPSDEDIDQALFLAREPRSVVDDFAAASAHPEWDAIDAPTGPLFPWDAASTALRPSPFAQPEFARSAWGSFSAHPLLVVGDDVTTDHISPAGAIPRDSVAADYLVGRGVPRGDLNVFASRRGNWELMLRGAFHNRNVRNRLAPDASTAHTVHAPTGEVVPLMVAAQRYAETGDSVVIVAGERYGMGSSRDWAAKVVRLLGVRAVLARSFERIHRTNLIGVGVLPIVVSGDLADALDGCTAEDRIGVEVTPEDLSRRVATVTVRRRDGGAITRQADLAVETTRDESLLACGGVIPFVLGAEN